ncbi:MAG: rhomboid family intramembrane serine protease [Actinomycetota bacterium]
MLNLIPISDANPTRSFPVVTIALIVANIVAFFQEPSLGLGGAAGRYFFANAPSPCQLGDTCPTNFPHRNLGSFLAAVLVSMFLHAGILHIAGNMLFLWVFGNNVEDFLGPVKYLVFYLLAGFAASFAHILTHINDAVPTVGASGAVAGVMGAYLVLFPRARVNVLVPIFFIFTIIRMSAFAVLGLWFLYQFLIGAQEATGATEVAWTAHVGGFVFGAVAVFVLGGRPHPPARAAWRPGWRL